MKDLWAFGANLSWQAIRVLGLAEYLRFLYLFFSNLPAIFAQRVLTTVDKGMGSKPLQINYQGTKFVFDCFYSDQRIRDGSYSFGIVREIYIRDCYFRHHHKNTFVLSRTVLDLGANRGAFSVLMASHSQKVICVDVVPNFADVIRRNMEINGFQNYIFECTLVGQGGSYSGPVTSVSTIEEIIHRNNLSTVDFLKMDVEGSEFVLFQSPSWLQYISYLSMEVHPEFGDPQLIVDSLKNNGFDYLLTDHMFHSTENMKQASYIYASKRDKGGNLLRD
jgi:hypothetical protein